MEDKELNASEEIKEEEHTAGDPVEAASQDEPEAPVAPAATATQSKAGKIVSIAINVLSVIIMLFAVIIVVNSLVSSNRGYPTFFGYAYYTVESDSMAKDVSSGEVKSDNFSRGDVIKVKIAGDNAEKASYKVGDVITFWDTIHAQKALDTHRIIEVVEEEGRVVGYYTKGDNNLTADSIMRTIDDVQGKYEGKASGIGNVILFLQSKTGFLICVLLPAALIMLYCIGLVVFNIVQYNKRRYVMAGEEAYAKAAAENSKKEEEMREQIRAQLLKEMAAKQEEQTPTEDKTEE